MSIGPRHRKSTREKTSRTKGRPSSDVSQDLRDKIITATRELLRTRPPDTISRIDIARAAGVDPGLVRYYFGSRDKVLSAVAKTFFDDFATDRHDAPPSGKIQDLVHQMIHFTMVAIERVPFMHELVLREIGRLGKARSAEMKSIFVERPTIRVKKALERTDSISLNHRELQFFRMMVIALASFPIHQKGFIEHTFGQEHFDAELTEEYCSFVARVFAQGLKNANSKVIATEQKK